MPPPIQRRLFRFLDLGGDNAVVQKVLISRFAAAVACPLADPATAFAPLSHMLRKGFFFVHGFFMMTSR